MGYPIGTDKQPVKGLRILVGESQATRNLGIRGADFAPQEYGIAVRPHTIVLIGRDWQPSDAEKELKGIPMAGGDTLPQTRHRVHYWNAVGLPGRDQGEIELPGLYDNQGTCFAAYDFWNDIAGFVGTARAKSTSSSRRSGHSRSV